MGAVPCEVPLLLCGANKLETVAVHGSRRPLLSLDFHLSYEQSESQNYTTDSHRQEPFYAHQVSHTHVSCEQTPGNPGVGRLTLPASRK